MFAESLISGILAKLSLGINRTLDSATIGADGRLEFWKDYFRQRIEERMAVDKKHKQLLHRLKKREKNGIAKPVVAKPLTMKAGERNRFTNKNAMVLLVIERTILALADDQDALDDRSVRDALASSIRSHRGQKVHASKESAKTSLSQQLSENLEKEYCSFFPNNNSQTTETWVDGMRGVYTSLCTSSQFSPGETSYIDNARQFLAKVGDG